MERKKEDSGADRSSNKSEAKISSTDEDEKSTDSESRSSRKRSRDNSLNVFSSLDTAENVLLLHRTETSASLALPTIPLGSFLQQASPLATTSLQPSHESSQCSNSRGPNNIAQQNRDLSYLQQIMDALLAQSQSHPPQQQQQQQQQQQSPRPLLPEPILQNPLQLLLQQVQRNMEVNTGGHSIGRRHEAAFAAVPAINPLSSSGQNNINSTIIQNILALQQAQLVQQRAVSSLATQNINANQLTQFLQQLRSSQSETHGQSVHTTVNQQILPLLNPHLFQQPSSVQTLQQDSSSNQVNDASIRTILQLLQHTAPSALEPVQVPSTQASMSETNIISNYISLLANAQNTVGLLSPSPSIAPVDGSNTGTNTINVLLQLLQQPNRVATVPTPPLLPPGLEPNSRGANLLESILLAQIGLVAQGSSTTPILPSIPSNRDFNANFASFPASAPAVEDIGVCLALDADFENLSEYQITMRQQLEFFVSKQEDVESNIQGRKKKIRLGQVGIRCRHCLHVPLRQRGRGAVYYPSKLSGVYQAAQNMAATHLSVSCASIPIELRQKLLHLHSRKDPASGGKLYWAEACQAVGLYEHEDGLRYHKSTNR